MKYFLTFMVGAVLGSLVTWKLVKDKYEQIAQEEIDSVKEVFSKKQKETKEPEKTEDPKPVQKKNPDNEKHIFEASTRERTDYVAYSNKYTTITHEKDEGNKNVEKPYIISPEEFGELDDYALIGLTHYSDGYLADDGDYIVENTDGEIVPTDYAEHFGEYEDDSVFVRNDRLKCDYEILYDQSKYAEQYPERIPK